MEFLARVRESCRPAPCEEELRERGINLNL